MEKEAVAREVERKKLSAFYDKAHFYLYDFGSHGNKLSKIYALPRPVIPLEVADAYNAQNGYGFLGKGGVNSWTPWDSKTPMEKGSVAFPGPDGFQFQVDAAPGTYDLELRAMDAANDAILTVSGSQGGDITTPLVNAGITKTKIVVTKQPIVINVPSNVKVQWLTLVESPSQTP